MYKQSRYEEIQYQIEKEDLRYNNPVLYEELSSQEEKDRQLNEYVRTLYDSQGKPAMSISQGNSSHREQENRLDTNDGSAYNQEEKENPNIGKIANEVEMELSNEQSSPEQQIKIEN